MRWKILSCTTGTACYANCQLASGVCTPKMDITTNSRKRKHNQRQLSDRRKCIFIEILKDVLDEEHSNEDAN